MKKPSRIVNLLKSVFKIRKWFDWDRVKSFFLFFVYGAKRVFIPQKISLQNSSSSFDETVKRLNLNEENLNAQKKSLFSLSILMVSSGFLIFSYAIYQLFYGSIKAFIVSLIITLVALVLAFRYNFWYFQIKKRKLGCTVQEWFREGLLGGKNE